jgi:hypothetical protein
VTKRAAQATRATANVKYMRARTVKVSVRVTRNEVSQYFKELHRCVVHQVLVARDRFGPDVCTNFWLRALSDEVAPWEEHILAGSIL